MGLIEAVQAWRPEVHDRLAAIAPRYIRNAVAVSAAVATQFTVPERTLKRFFGILRAADGDVIEATRIAPAYSMRPETFLAVLDAVRSVDSYDAANGNDGQGRDLAASPIWDNAAPDVEDRILVEAAFKAVDTLEKDIVRMAYGFTEHDPLPDEEIGHRIGFTRPKTQRIRAGALAKMREAIGGV
jgi:DNA-directed RNA polymerase specialized sigma subunit